MYSLFDKYQNTIEDSRNGMDFFCNMKNSSWANINMDLETKLAGTY